MRAPAVPYTWKTQRLAEIVTDERPITYGIVLPGPDVPGGVPYIRVVDMENGDVHEERLRRTSSEIAEQYRRSAVLPGDLLLSIRGHVGRLAVVPQGLNGANITQDTARIALGHHCHPRYVFWYLHSPDAQRWMERNKKGVAVRGINLADVREIPVPLPPRPEQHRIAAILDKADAIRRKRQEAEDSSRELIPAIFRQTFGNLVTNSMNWPMAALGDVCDSRLGKMLDAKQQTGRHLRPYLRNTNVQWDRLDLIEVFEMDFDEQDRQEFELRPGDVLVCEGGEVGRTAIWNGELAECYFQKAIHRVRPHPAKMCPEYLLHLMREMARHDQFRFATSQATIAHLTGVKLKGLSLPLPPIELQRRFAGKVAAVKRLHRKKQEARSQADVLFQSLVQRAFRGQL